MPDLTLPEIGRTLPVAAGESILTAALSAGIDYPHGCKSGRCGRCKSHLVEGRVDLLDHSRFALTAEDREAGLILACRAVPLTPVTVAWIPRVQTETMEPAGKLEGA